MQQQQQTRRMLYLSSHCSYLLLVGGSELAIRALALLQLEQDLKKEHKRKSLEGLNQVTSKFTRP
jgi:hypothetical protein